MAVEVTTYILKGFYVNTHNSHSISIYEVATTALSTSQPLWEPGSAGNSFYCFLHMSKLGHRKTVTCLKSYRAGNTTAKHFLGAQYMLGSVLSALHGPRGLENSCCSVLPTAPAGFLTLHLLISAFLCGVDGSLATGLISWLEESPIAGGWET